MHTRVAKKRARNSRVKLSEACQEKLLDAVIRESEGMHVIHYTLLRRAIRYVNKLLQDNQAVIDNDLQIVEILRRQCIPGRGRCLQKSPA
jgi:hypothetical protein